MTFPFDPPPLPCPLEPHRLEAMHVLLAEDNRTNRLLIQAFLADLPLRLSFAHDGVEAVARTADLLPDIVLMDINMPRLTGLEATAEIRRLDLAQPAIIALTAHSDACHTQACLDAGMDAFLSKPVQRAALLRALAERAPAPSACQGM